MAENVDRTAEEIGEEGSLLSSGDLESLLGLSTRGGTAVGSLASICIAVLLTGTIYGAVTFFSETTLYRLLYERGVMPPFIVGASAWCGAILLLKRGKLSVQRAALGRTVAPNDPSFVISAASTQRVLVEIWRIADQPRRYILFNRLLNALSNLKNLGRVTDVDEILRAQAEQDEAAVETSYALVRGLIWAIPTLGFIGTVLGLSSAIGGFGSVLAANAEVSQLTESLQGVTAGLATAFDTTLIALVAAVMLHAAYTLLYQAELEFLDDCSEYCQRHIVNRLRVDPHDDETT